MTAEKVHELIGRARELPWGQARTIVVEEALRAAEATGDPRLAFAVRMELRREYERCGERAKAFAMFARCLADHDRDPAVAGDPYPLLWAFKGTVRALAEFPDVPLDRTLAALDDMERRYRLAGQGLQPVYACRTVVTQHVSGAASADEWYARWHAAPRTELSDCQGCDPSLKVAFLAERGRDEDAIALAEPVLRGVLTCVEQPHGILTNLMPVYLRTGRFDAAADAHRRAYRTQRTQPAELWAIALHLEFCARTGNEARGLELLERHLGWLDRAPTPHDGMRFAASAALLLRRLAETGHGDVTVHRPAHGERPAQDVPAETLRAELTAYAAETAARFDARNGTPRQGMLVRELLDAEPVVEFLPLTPQARALAARPPAPVPPPATFGDAGDVDGLLDLAEEHWQRLEFDQAFAAWERVDALGGELTTLQRARRLDGEGLRRQLAGDTRAATGHWREAAELYDRAGAEELRWSAVSRYAATLCQDDRAGEGLPLLESALAWLDEHAGRRSRALAARFRLAVAYAEAGRTEEALALLDAAEPGDDPDLAAELDLARARALLIAGRTGPAAGALRRAMAGYRAGDRRTGLANAALLLGQVLAGSDAEEDRAEAGEVLTTAVVNAPARPAGLRSAAHAVRGRWLLSRERFAEAAEDLIEAVAGLTAEGAHAQAAHARQDLCVAYLNTGRALEAAEVAEEALPVFEALGDVPAHRRTRFLLAGAQRELGELADAAETLTALAGEERAEHPAAAADLLENAGDLLSRLDKDASAAERFAEAAEAYTAAGDAIGTARSLRRQAMCLLWSDRAEDGLWTMATARARLHDVDPGDDARTRGALVWEMAVIDYDEARILGALGRLDEAVAGAERAVAGFTALGQDEAARTAEELRADLVARSAGAEDAAG